MLNNQLLREFEKGLPGPIYYIWSGESCFLEDALSRAVGIVIASHPSDFNYDTFHPSATPQEISNSIETLPFMAPRRLVVLKDFHLFPAPTVKALMPYFKGPVETACLVVLSQKAPSSSLSDAGWKVYQLNIQERDIPAWLKQAAAEKGVRLTDDAVDNLLEYVGYEIGLLIMELEKLASMGSGTISGKDILSSTSMMREFTTFDLIDSLIAGQKAKAFRILKTMFSRNAYEAPVILGTLNWHYRQFYSLWLNKGKRPVKMKERTYRTLVRYLPSFDEKDFYFIFRNLHEADLGVKSSGRPELVIEVLLVRLLQKGAWR
ncbi:MAG: DNA polymerase III subunit delta [Nitrospiraceae bacterium]|nr:MAG: DNA polymerase III subunit delta [Nitrospiraceae bacterium]